MTALNIPCSSRDKEPEGYALQPNEIAVYLRRGLGRVVLFLREQENGAVRFRDVILYAVLHDVRYDRQSEEHRAPYLYDVIEATGETDWYAALLCDALQESSANEESDEEQRCELAGLFAQKGDAIARRALYTAFERSVRAGNPIGAEVLISLDGATGFQRVAQAYQDTGLTDDDANGWFGVNPLIEKLGGANEARQATNQMVSDTPKIAPFIHQLWEEWERVQNKPFRWKPSELEPPTYDRIQAGLDEVVRTAGQSPSRHFPFRLWSRTVADETLLRLARDIEAGADGERLLNLLLFFDKRTFPLPPNVLLPLTFHTNPRIAFRAVHALSRLTHPDVRSQGLQFIQTDRVAEGVMLLIHNPGENDTALFAGLLDQTHDDGVLHRIGMDVRDYYEAQPSPDLIPVLLTLYEKGPCSMCRGSTVDLLIKANALPDALRSECRYDADEGTREAVASPSDEQ